MAYAKTGTVARLLREWWGHRGSLAISLVVMLVALVVYFATFVGERPTPGFDSIDRLELNTLDARFQFRGRVTPDPRIIIVDIDQRSQEVLGRWPFPRIHFAHLMDALREDGAKVAAFDMTFSKPDQTVLPLQDLSKDLAAQKKQGMAVNSGGPVRHRSPREAIQLRRTICGLHHRFGHVVLGNYFLYTKADLEGVSDESLDKYANSSSFFPFPEVYLSQRRWATRTREVIHLYEDQGLNLFPAALKPTLRFYRRRRLRKRGGRLLQRGRGCGYGRAPRYPRDYLTARSRPSQLGLLRLPGRSGRFGCI